MWNSSWHEHGCPCWGIDLFVAKPECKCPLKDVPRLIVGVVDMKVVRAASAPLVNIKGLPGRRDRLLVSGSVIV